jgi:hypothetical protein
MAIPEALLTKASHAPADFPLAYNLVAILWVNFMFPVKLFVLIFIHAWSVAYAFASRHLSAYPLSSSFPEAHDLVSRLVPFLVARDDKTRFPGIESATTDIFSRFDEVRLSPEP